MPLPISTSRPSTVTPSRLMLLLGVLMAFARLLPTPAAPSIAELEALIRPSPMAETVMVPVGLIRLAPWAPLIWAWALLVIVEEPTTTAAAE